MIAEEGVDLGLALGLGGRVELTEVAENLIGFEVDAFDRVIVTATLDGGPVHDVIGGGTHWVAHLGLLEDFFEARASLAAGEEFLAGGGGAVDAVDDIEEAEFQSIDDGDAVEEIPGTVDS